MKMVIEQAFLVLSLALLLAVVRLQPPAKRLGKNPAANTTDAYELFLKKYPSGEFTAQAQARVKELYEERDWQKARDTDTHEAYQAFLKQYPEGKWAEEARIRVENFTLAAGAVERTPAGADSANTSGNTPPALPSTAVRQRRDSRAPKPLQCRRPQRRRVRPKRGRTDRVLRRTARRVQVRCRCGQQALGALEQGISQDLVGTVAHRFAEERFVRAPCIACRWRV